MDKLFKAAMDAIKADEALKKRTEVYVMNALSKGSKAKRTNPLTKRVVAVACAAILLCGASVVAYAYYKTPTSYISLDINPSVELGVNAFDKVISAEAYNNDGKIILEDQNVINSDVKTAVNTLVVSAANNGFIEKDGSSVISITAETDDQSTAKLLESEAEKGVNNAITETGTTAIVRKDNVALARRDEARRLGITPGKLNLIQKLQALDPAITVDQYKNAKVKDIMNKFTELNREREREREKNGLNNNSSAAVSSGIGGSSSNTATVSSGIGSSSSNAAKAKAGDADPSGKNSNGNRSASVHSNGTGNQNNDDKVAKQGAAINDDSHEKQNDGGKGDDVSEQHGKGKSGLTSNRKK